MSFPKDVKERALIACSRCCCLCHQFKGIKIELHHIVAQADGGENTFENCIPLCFDCHADQRSYDHKHPKGTKYTDTELIQRRDDWYNKVACGTFPNAPTSLPIGSLRFSDGVMEVRRKILTNEISAQMSFTIHNDSDVLVEFIASLDGNVNGATSPRGIISLSGYINQKNSTKILYDMIFNIKASEQADISTPLLVGILKYSIKYKHISSICFDRSTSKTLTYRHWQPFLGVPNEKTVSITVMFSDQAET